MRRSQNQRSPQIPEMYPSSDACVLCRKYCGSNNTRNSLLVCQPCSKKVGKLETKLSLMKKKLVEWKELTQDRIKSPLIRLFDEPSDED